MFDFLPTLEEFIQAVLPTIEWMFLVFPLISGYVTYVHWKWWRAYRPSPLIRHLLISSAAVDISALIVAFIVANAFEIIPIDLPTGANTLLLALALGISLGVTVYRRISLRALDKPDVNIEQRVETQDEREDREFGEKRRGVEAKHIEETKRANQE
jgi:vacuolar-type H+-ATPase subunit I/STV1